MAKTFSFPDIQTPSDIAWFQDQLDSSGITKPLADSAGLVLQPGRYLIPYWDSHGDPTSIVKARIRPAEGTVDSMGYKVEAPAQARYITVHGKGLGTLPYWPKFPNLNHAKALADLDHSLWITEGEKKAIALQAAITGQGYSGSAVAMGGVAHTKALIKQLDTMGFSTIANGTKVPRNVFIALDWNDPAEAAKDAEFKLYEYLTGRGADVTILRWPVTDNAGEQKIDDWLVSGGRLSDAIDHSRINEIIPVDELGLAMAWFDARYAKLSGKIVRFSDSHVYQKSDFQTQYLHKYERELTKTGSRKLRHVDLWLEREDTRTLKGLTFQPWGVMDVARERPDIIDDELNLFKGWPSKPVEGDVDLLLKHLAHVFPDPEHRAWFAGWVAHMIQKPYEQPATYVCLVSRSQGTGKSLTTRLLATLLGRQYATMGNRESWTGRFNASWGGALLVYTEEMQTHSSQAVRAMSERIKEVVGSDTLSIERKGRDSFTTSNFIRYIFTGNTAAMAYLDKQDRRAAYFAVENKLPTDQARELVEWLKLDGAISAMLHYFGTYDLSGFDASAPALRTDAREEAIDASATELDAFIDDIADGVVLGERVIWSTNDIYLAFEQNYGAYRSGKPHMVSVLKRAGVLQTQTVRGGKNANTFWSGGKMLRLWCVRDHASWIVKDDPAWVAESIRT